MNKSIISWTKRTWNPVHGCSVVDADCKNCYAARLSLQKGFTQKPWTMPNAEENIRLQWHKLEEPFRLKEPTLIFVNSMSDLFHPLVPDDYIREIWWVMKQHPQHTFQILTKRPARAAAWEGPWLPHIWMGTSIGHRKALKRLDELRPVPAAVRWVSFEPLWEDLGPNIDLTGYSWSVVGGESGPGYRKMDMAWARSIRDQCAKQDVAFFFKQDSAYRTEIRPWLVEEDGAAFEWHQMPGKLIAPEQIAVAH